MKRTITILLALLMVLSLAACGGSKNNVFDKLYSPMTQTYLPEDRKGDSQAAIKKAVTDILGEPDDSSVGTNYSKYLLIYDYNDIELYGLMGHMSVYFGFYYSVIELHWGYNIPRGTEKTKVEKIVSSLVKKMDARYGKHYEDDGEYRYIWKDNSGMQYGMIIYSDSLAIHVKKQKN